MNSIFSALTNAQDRHFATYSKAVRTGAIMAEMRQANLAAIRTAVGPRAAAAAAESAIRDAQTPEENRRRTARQTAAFWQAQRKVGVERAIAATRLTKSVFLDGASLAQFFSPRPAILTKAEIDPVLAEMLATAKGLTTQELAWLDKVGQGSAARTLAACESVADVRHVFAGDIKAAAAAARGAGTGRPRKVKPGSVEDMVRIAFTSAPFAAGPREVGVDGRVGNLPVRVEGCTCAGYGFNGSVTCAGHGYAVRPAQDVRHPMAKGHRVDSYLDGRIASVRMV